MDVQWCEVMRVNCLLQKRTGTMLYCRPVSTLSYLRIRIGHTVIQKIAFVALVAFLAFLVNPILCEAAVGYGTAVQLHSEDNPATYLCTRTLDSTHFVEVFTDEINSNYGTAVIGTVSGTSVSFGSKAVFNTNSTYYSNVIVIDATHIAVVYVNSSYDGKARIGTISGDSISFGAEATFDATQVETFSAKLLDSTHIVIGYAAYEGGYLGRAVVGTVSGTTISFGSYATFNSGMVYYGPTLSVFDSTHFILFYGERVSSDARARMILGTVSGGTSLSFGTETNFSASTTIYITPDGSDTLDSTHVAVLYRDPAIDNNAVRTFIVTWDGGTTLTVGTSKKHDITPNISRSMSMTAVNATTFVANFSQQSYYHGSSFVGTVTDGSTITLGSVYNFDAAGTEYDVSGDMLDATHLIVTYRDRDDSNRSTAVVGTLAGNVISFGAENSMNSNTGYIGTVAADGLDATHAVVAYTSASAYGRASIATITGTAVSLGTASTFNATTTSQTAVVMLDATHFIAAYRDSDTYGRAVVGTVSDTTITYGSEYAFNSAATTYISLTALDSTHFIVAYKDSDNYGRAVVGTISGTTISYGSEYAFNSAATSYISVTGLDATHFIASYQDSDAYGRAIVGTVSDTTISYGSEYVFNSASTSYVSAVALGASTFVVAYKDSDTYGRAIVGTVSGTAISYGSEYAFNAAATNYIAIDKISATQFIAGYSDSGNSSYGTLLTGTVAGTVISFDAESTYASTATSINTITTLSSSSFLASYRNDAATVGMTIVASNDSSPPAPSSFSPASASTISDATQTITFTTDENATCKVSLTDQAYADMSVTCTGGGTTSQSCTTPDLGTDGAKTAYIACTDGTNADTADTNESLSYTLDTTAPVLSAFSPANAATLVSTGSSISWMTDELAASQVQYGFSSAIGNLTSRTDTSPRVTSHSVSLGTLQTCTTYYYRAMSADASWNTTTGSTLSFTTTGCVNNAGVDTETGSSLPAGGTGSLTTNPGGAGANVTIPASELPTPLVLQIKKLTDDTVVALTSTPAGKHLTGDHTYSIRAFRGDAPVTTFTDPVRVVIAYNDPQVTGLLESTLWIFRWDGSSWNALSDCTVDTTANTVSCTTTHFSTFGLFGEAASTTTSGNTPATSAAVSTGGHRGSAEGMAQKIAVARQNVLARFMGNMRQSVALETETEILHTAPVTPDAFATGEQRSLYRAATKMQDAAAQREAEQLRLSGVAQRRGFLYALVDEAPVLYKDVAVDTWYAPYVANIVENGIATGYKDEAGKPTGEYGVTNPVTYAEALKMAWKAAGKDLKDLPPPRNDSAQGTWVSAYVAEAEAMKLSVFTPSLNVHAPATRGAVVQIILEVLRLPIASQPATFSDVPSSHPNAHAIATATFYGFITGDSDAQGKALGTFRPDEQINRAEVSKIIALAKEVLR